MLIKVEFRGGGGDAKTEGRINDIRVDLLNWMNAGGAMTLQLPDSMTYEDYFFGNSAKELIGMSTLLADKAVVVSAIASAQEKDDEEELNTKVNGQPKTCKGFISKKDHLPHVLCNIERFWGMSESEQYQQIHHEYAGLGRIERNEGAASDYSISRQITSLLVPVMVLKLAVKPPLGECLLEYGILRGHGGIDATWIIERKSSQTSFTDPRHWIHAGGDTASEAFGVYFEKYKDISKNDCVRVVNTYLEKNQNSLKWLKYRFKEGDSRESPVRAKRK